MPLPRDNINTFEKIMNHFFREIIRSIKFMLLDSEKEVHRMIDEG